MIDEAIGKILGMVMAYGASALGMFVAYLNYRKRIVKAERVMSGAAWTVLLATLLALAGGAVVVLRLAGTPAVEAAPVEAAPVEIAPPEAAEHGAEMPPAEAAQPPAQPAREAARDEWPWVGILIPALIFLFATVVTASLHRRFSTHGPEH